MAHPMTLQQAAQNILRGENTAESKRLMISKLGLAKTAALIIAVACVVFVIFVPKILAALMVLPILILCYEVAIATGNLQSIVDQFSREWMQQRHPRDLIPMLTKGTLLTKIIVSKMERDGVFN